VFVTGEQAGAPIRTGLTGLRLVRSERRTFTGPAAFLDDPGNRADLDRYLSDLTRDYPELGPTAAAGGQSYGEMAEALIGAVTSADQPVDLLVLAYAIHDLQPGRATATYLSHVCPGVPLSFAICDQGSAAAFTSLRIARDFLASTGRRRALLIVVEQATLPYASAADRPAQHRGVAMLLESEPAESEPAARLVALRQRPNLAAEAVPGQAVADLAELSAGYRETRVVLSPALAAAWPARPGPPDQPGQPGQPGQPDQLTVGPAAQPSTSAWWQLITELDEIEQLSSTDRPDLLVVADYDPQLRYLCLAAIEPG